MFVQGVSFRRCLMLVAISAACSRLLTPACLAQSGRGSGTASSEERDVLRSFLLRLLRARFRDHDKTTRYLYCFVDLNGDGTPEAIVYLAGREWCGSGGCPTIILSRSGSSYRVVTWVLITRPPIRVLASASNGWRDLAVWVQGGGILRGYEAELRFDGKTYPINPSIPPAVPLTRKVAGDVVLPTSEGGILLFP